MSTPIVLSTSRYTQLAASITGLLSGNESQGISAVDAAVFRDRFPDGERHGKHGRSFKKEGC